MGHLDVEAWLLVLAALGMAVLGLLAWRTARRVRTRRRRRAVEDAGLRLSFDACAPEGGDLSLEPFRLGRLRFDPLDEHERPRRGPA
jgi:hypothetical protein